MVIIIFLILGLTDLKILEDTLSRIKEGVDVKGLTRFDRPAVDWLGKYWSNPTCSW